MTEDELESKRPEGTEESDQLPEDAPQEVAGDGTSDDTREEAKDSAGAGDESDPDQATGRPENAG